LAKEICSKQKPDKAVRPDQRDLRVDAFLEIEFAHILVSHVKLPKA